uniref:Uncharacterized protein n=1 Tax=Scytodes thoracica TaxID=1112478 RepID=A0A0A0VCS2_SCYTH|nr:hypothetical protein [Scytodes thoracica]
MFIGVQCGALYNYHQLHNIITKRQISAEVNIKHYKAKLYSYSANSEFLSIFLHLKKCFDRTFALSN